MGNSIIIEETYELVEGYERIEKIIKSDYIPKPPFRMMGNGKKNKQGESLDLVEEMSKMTPQELWLFNLIEHSRIDRDANVSSLIKHKFTNAEKQKLNTGYKRLREKDLIRRIKRQHYMINPRLIIPKDDWKTQDSIYKDLK